MKSLVVIAMFLVSLTVSAQGIFDNNNRGFITNQQNKGFITNQNRFDSDDETQSYKPKGGSGKCWQIKPIANPGCRMVCIDAQWLESCSSN